MHDPVAMYVVKPFQNIPHDHFDFGYRQQVACPLQMVFHAPVQIHIAKFKNESKFLEMITFDLYNIRMVHFQQD
jgi:hypothetical protein